MTEDQNIFTDKEAANYLRISQVTLWRERRRGRITYRWAASRIVYLRQDLDEYLENNICNAPNAYRVPR